MPRFPPPLGRPPTREEILDMMETLELVLGDMMRRWENGILPETRAEIMTKAYEPVLQILIRTRRRPVPR